MSSPLTFRSKLLLAFAATALITAGVGAVSYIAFEKVANCIVRTDTVDLPASLAIANADMLHDGLRAVAMLAVFDAERREPGREAAVREELAEFTAGIHASIATVESLALDSDAKTALLALKPDIARYTSQAARIVDLAYRDRSAGADAVPTFIESFKLLEGSLEKLGKLLESHSNAAVREGNRVATIGARIVLFAASAGFLLAIGLGLGFGRTLLATLKPLIAALEETAGETSSAADELAGASHSLAEGASRNAAALEEAGAALEEMSSMTKRNARSAATGKELSAQTRQAAQEGTGRLREMSETVAGIKGAVAEMQIAVVEMQASSEEVAKIIKTIDEIAFQTNLLALNAAVEAARAGEAGMGFAVVADEVRVLAQRSAQAAKDTAERIENSIKRSEHGAVASGAVVKNLAGIEATAVKVQQGFDSIFGKVTSLDEVIAEVAAASHEQSQGVGEVARAVGDMDKISQASAANAEENASAAQQLTSRATALRQVVASLQAFLGQSDSGPNPGFGLGTATPPKANAPATSQPTAASAVFQRSTRSAHSEQSPEIAMPQEPSFASDRRLTESDVQAF